MVKRIWDKKNKYPDAVLKEYKHWVLEVSYRQHTLGCYIIFAKRPIERISELQDEEIVELKNIMLEVEEALSRIPSFKPDRFNYWQLGNNLHHLHFFGIPRYAKSRNFAGKKWIDKTWGTVPVWSKKDTDYSLVREIRNSIKSHLR
jgi:diadenosine tetraphosphate (Ap4A) HIT family hydrolase